MDRGEEGGVGKEVEEGGEEEGEEEDQLHLGTFIHM